MVEARDCIDAELLMEVLDMLVGGLSGLSILLSAYLLGLLFRGIKTFLAAIDCLHQKS